MSPHRPPPRKEPAGSGLPSDLIGTLHAGINTVFESMGRALVCLDGGFRVVRASPGIDRLVGPGAALTFVGRDAEEVFGEALFGASGALRRALLAGERREGWGATVVAPSGRRRLLSLSAAPVRHDLATVCDPQVAYFVVVRGADEIADGTGPRAQIVSGLVARSPAMLRILELVESLAESDATVLVTGESGTGKELVARALHASSPRRDGPFVAVNCGAIPADLLESELFGHVRGAFTGAVRDREGRFEVASAGTLFLDEVGEMPLPLQVKILRVLQERTFERVGESRSRRTDARIIAATNVNLRRAVAAGRFREDLYYRLRVLPIEVPPLRERPEDVPLLAEHLLGRTAARHGRSLILSPDALRVLLDHSWPGNVRELENALEYAVAVARGQTILPHDLPAEIASGRAAGGRGLPGALADVPLGEVDAPEREVERRRLRQALEEHQWRRAEAAEALGMSRTTLWRRMRELGLD